MFIKQAFQQATPAWFGWKLRDGVKAKSLHLIERLGFTESPSEKQVYRKQQGVYAKSSVDILK